MRTFTDAVVSERDPNGNELSVSYKTLALIALNSPVEGKKITPVEIVKRADLYDKFEKLKGASSDPHANKEDHICLELEDAEWNLLRECVENTPWNPGRNISNFLKYMEIV